jgi:hypothetical protein
MRFKIIDEFSCPYVKKHFETMISQWYKIQERQNIKNKPVHTPRPKHEKVEVHHDQDDVVRNQDDNKRLEFERSDLHRYLSDEIECNRSIENATSKLKQLNMRMVDHLKETDEEPVVHKPSVETKKLKRVTIKPMPTLSIPKVINGAKIAVKIKT